jgi:hypothetical protein
MTILHSRIVKIIAMIAMLFDHIGFYLYPNQQSWRIVGRIAFPLFAFLIAFGATKTRSIPKFCIRLLGFGVIVQAAMSIGFGYWYHEWYNVFVTLGLGVFCIWMMHSITTHSVLLWRPKSRAINQNGKTRSLKGACNRDCVDEPGRRLVYKPLFKTLAIIACCVGGVILAFLVGIYLPIDYGVAGVLSIILFYLALSYSLYIAKCVAPLIILLFNYMLLHNSTFVIQWYALMAVPIILLFDPKYLKTHWIEKWSFYIFYPLHAGLLLLLS